MKHPNTIISAAAIILSLLLLVAGWFFLVPAIEKAAASLAEKTVQKEEYEKRVADLKAAEKKLLAAGQPGGIPATEEELIAAMPPHRDYEDVLAMVENMAALAGINEAVAISLDTAPSGDKNDQGAAKVELTPLTVTTSGGYDSIKQFIELLQGGLRPIAIESVDLMPTESGAVSLGLTATTYTRNMPTPTAAATQPDSTSQTESDEVPEGELSIE